MDEEEKKLPQTDQDKLRQALAALWNELVRELRLREACDWLAKFIDRTNAKTPPTGEG